MRWSDKQELVAWARSMRWDWFVTPTFRYAVSMTTAMRHVEDWMHKLGGGYAFAGYQRSEAGLVHAHLMIGGVGRGDRIRDLLTESWQRRGNVDLDRFHPTGGAIEYLVAQAEEFDVIGTPKEFRPR